MSKMNCPKQEEVTKATRSNNWPEPIAAHVAKCEICRDVTHAARWMQALAGDPVANVVAPGIGSLPDPELVWWKAQISKNHSGTKKGRLFMEALHVASMVIAPIGLAGWVAWNWYDIQAVAERFLLDTWPQISIATYALASLAPAVLALAALAVGYPLFGRE